MKMLFVIPLIFVATTIFSQSQRVAGRTKETDTSSPETIQYAFPAGATAGFNELDVNSSNAGGLLGFQIWKSDSYFFSFFVSYAGELVISGKQSDFGKYLLNPSMKGPSLLVFGNMTITNNALWNWGIAGRAGVSFSTWRGSIDGEEQSESALVLFACPAIQLSTVTFGKGSKNEYQVGLDFGPGVRLLGSDVAQEEDFISDENILGKNQMIFFGLECTVFARLNNVQPFVRLSWYFLDQDVSGFSGLQGFLGFSILSTLFEGDLSKNN